MVGFVKRDVELQDEFGVPLSLSEQSRLLLEEGVDFSPCSYLFGAECQKSL